MFDTENIEICLGDASRLAAGYAQFIEISIKDDNRFDAGALYL
jgi:hypothetical protein